MKKLLLFIVLLFAAPLILPAQAPAALLFTENRGQVADDKGHLAPDILFTAQSKGVRLFLTATGIHYQFTRTVYPAGYVPDRRRVNDRELQASLGRQAQVSTHRFSLLLEGAHPRPHIRKELKSDYTEHFYLAHCPEGITDVATYGRIVYEGVYPGIDWVVYSKEGGLKYDFIVHPGADPSRIRLRVTDADAVHISPSGELVLQTGLGEIREQAPVSFSGKGQVPTRFRQLTDGSIGFAVGSYNKELPLTIDPTVLWSTYYGGSGDEEATSCGVDGSGNVFITGSTSSTSGIAASGFQNTFGTGANDAYLVKFSPTGTRLWATYYGGNGYEFSTAGAVDASGNSYITGHTNTTGGLASPGGFQTGYNGGYYDCFLVKFGPSGTRLWATYYGGGDDDEAFGCTTDNSGNVYISGHTLSTSSIASGGYQNTLGGAVLGAFLVKFSAAGARIWGTYYSGNLSALGTACITDGSGNVYLTGYTNSVNGIASGGHQLTFGGGSSFGDAFLVKFSSGGARLWATYYGGSGDEICNNLAVDPSGNIYMAGITGSTSAIASGGTQNTYGGGSWDAFLAKFNTAGTRQWATYYGGSGDDGGTCAVDSSGAVYLGGTTTSATGIALSGFQNSIAGGLDGFAVRMDPAGTRLWASYFGGPADDIVRWICTDRNGDLYLAGRTNSSTAVAFNGFQTTYGGGPNDALLNRITDNPVMINSVSPTVLCAGATLTITFTPLGTFSTGNVFTAQLSDATGSFANPVNIGTLTGTAAGTITAIIPATTPYGTGYRVRILASAPAATGYDNGGNITINPLPAQPGPIIGPVAVCIGSLAAYNVIPVPNAVTYTWTLPPGWTGTSTNTGIVSIAGNTGGTISVTANNGCGSSAPQTLTVVVSSAPPAQPGPITGDTLVCPNAAQTYTVAPASGAVTYNWTLPAGWTGTSTTDTISATTGTSGGVISVTAVNGCGSSAAQQLAVTVRPTIVPTVTVTASPGINIALGQQVTFTAAITNGGPNPQYQWFKNGAPVAGAVSNSYSTNSLVHNDIVSVRLISNAPCARPDTIYSNFLAIHVTNGIAQAGRTSGTVSVYPNPTTGSFTVHASWSMTGNGQPVVLELIDPIGQMVYAETLHPVKDDWQHTVHPGRQLSNGVYLLRVRAEGRQEVMQVIICR